MEATKAGTTPMRIGGDIITRYLREDYERGGMDAAKALRDETQLTLSDTELALVCTGNARIDGFTHDEENPLRFVTEESP